MHSEFRKVFLLLTLIWLAFCTFGSVAAHAVQIANATVTLLPNGQFLQSGGDQQNQIVSDLALYNATTQQTTQLSIKLATARKNHSATVLPDGTILILGGLGQDGYPVATAELVNVVLQKTQLIGNTFIALIQE